MNHASHSGYTPARDAPERSLRAMSPERLVQECSYRGAELVIAQTRIALLERQLKRTRRGQIVARMTELELIGDEGPNPTADEAEYRALEAELAAIQSLEGPNA